MVIIRDRQQKEIFIAKGVWGMGVILSKYSIYEKSVWTFLLEGAGGSTEKWSWISFCWRCLTFETVPYCLTCERSRVQTPLTAKNLRSSLGYNMLRSSGTSSISGVAFGHLADPCKTWTRGHEQADTEVNLLVNTRTLRTSMNRARTRPHKYHQCDDSGRASF